MMSAMAASAARLRDPRSQVGIFSRGKNVYPGGSSAAHSGGGPQFGRPPNNPFAAAIKRRLAKSG